MTLTSFGYMQMNTLLRFVGTRTSQHDDSISTIMLLQALTSV
jgi:hypothetical protein